MNLIFTRVLSITLILLFSLNKQNPRKKKSHDQQSVICPNGQIQEQNLKELCGGFEGCSSGDASYLCSNGQCAENYQKCSEKFFECSVIGLSKK